MELQSRLDNQFNDIDEELYNRHKVNKQIIQKLMKENENNKQIKEFSSLIDVNVKRLFRNEPLDFKLQVPEVSNEAFIEYLTLAYETF